MPLKDIALTFIPQLGPRGAAYLVESFGSAEAVYAASKQEIIECTDLHEPIAREIFSGRGLREAERELAYCRRHDIVPIRAIPRCCAKWRIALRCYM